MSHRVLLDVTKNSRESQLPGKEGVAFTAEQIPAVIEALQKAVAELDAPARKAA